MNVPNISQGPGSLTTLPRLDAGGDTTPQPRADAVVSAPVRSHAPQPTISLTRLAWFDANGDGRIDPRAASDGGDATLLVPTHEVDLPTYSRSAHPFGVGQSRGHEAGDRLAHATGNGSGASNPAQANRAVDAYQRYGQPPAPTGPDLSLAPSGAPVGDAVAPVVVGLQAQAQAPGAPTPAAPAPPVPQPTAAGDLTPSAARAVG